MRAKETTKDVPSIRALTIAPSNTRRPCPSRSIIAIASGRDNIKTIIAGVIVSMTFMVVYVRPLLRHSSPGTPQIFAPLTVNRKKSSHFQEMYSKVIPFKFCKLDQTANEREQNFISISDQYLILHAMFLD